MATRSLLVSYAGYPYSPSSLMPDNGLANLAGSLMEAGHETRVIDYGTVDTMRALYPEALSKKAMPLFGKIFKKGKGNNKPSLPDLLSLIILNRRLQRSFNRAVGVITEKLVQEVKEFKPDFVGFKLWNGDGFSGSIMMAERLKREFPSIRLFAGGPHVDLFKEHIYSASDIFDALVYAEGEDILPMLSRYCEGEIGLAEIPNLIYKAGHDIRTNEVRWIEDLDLLPLPVYDEEIYPSMRGDQKIKIIVIDESRGCPCGCAFCIQPIKSGSRLRLKSHERVVNEIKMIIDAFGTTSFRYAGSATPLRHAVNIAKSVMQENLKITYSSFGHIQRSRESDFETLKKSGCHSIFFGIESGSKDVLRRGFAKKSEPELVREVMKACRRAGIFTVGSVIFPAPFETDETEKETLDLLRDVKPDAVPIQFPGIMPGTEWRRNPEKYNMRITSRDYEKEIMNYKIKLLYPPRYWAALPYTVNNMDFAHFTRLTEKFARAVESAGILTHISDDQALMALHAGYEGREKAFRDQLRYSFAAGDVTFVEQLVCGINDSIKRTV